mgnify:CR=1 FL=1
MEEKKMTFEQALGRLEEIVTLLEKGDAPLDQSLELYEEGAALVRRCHTALEQAERRVTVLMKDQEGTVTEQVFDAEALNEA